MNKVLERQIKKYLNGVDISSLPFQEFIQAVSTSYDDAENDQDLIDRSLDISSREMIDRNELERKRAATNEKAIEMLRAAVTTLDPHSFIESIKGVDPTQEVISLAQFLSDLTVKYKQNMYELILQKVHAENLSSELQVFKFAVENAADYIIFMDANFKIIYANRVALVGLSSVDIIGKTVDEAYAFLDVNGTTGRLNARMLKGDKQFTSEFTLHRQYNEAAVIQVATTVSSDSQNRKLIINIGRDITKDRALEHEKDEFVSIASHELRTPMTIIRGYISLLNREQLGDLNDKQKEILTKMNDTTVGLINFVAEMLDLSKLDAGKFEVTPVDVSVEGLISGSVEKMRVIYDTKGVTLMSHVEPAQIKTDPGQFDRIISNLLGNAYKFTQKGGTVTVSNTIDNEARLVTVCVADTGVGIPPEAIETLFKKFTQVDNVLQRQSGGSGLGLVIAKQLVEKLGGTIWVKSKFGEGSQFFFTMPMS